MGNVEVWIIPAKKKILVTEYPGPPAAICGFLSQEAKEAAQKRGHATISEIGFPSECLLGSFESPTFGWGKAKEAAETKAKELGYIVEYEPFMDLEDEDY